MVRLQFKSGWTSALTNTYYKRANVISYTLHVSGVCCIHRTIFLKVIIRNILNTVQVVSSSYSDFAGHQTGWLYYKNEVEDTEQFRVPFSISFVFRRFLYLQGIKSVKRLYELKSRLLTFKNMALLNQTKSISTNAKHMIHVELHSILLEKEDETDYNKYNETTVESTKQSIPAEVGNQLKWVNLWWLCQKWHG